MVSLLVQIDEQTYQVELGSMSRDGDAYRVSIDGESLAVTLPQPSASTPEIQWIIIDGRPYDIVFDPNLHWINAYDGLHSVEVQDSHQHVARPRSGDGRVKAPIPGLITRVLVEPGMAVTADQPLMILEAMKMENEIRAPFDGVVSSVSVAGGQTVVRNQLLVEVQ